MPGGRAERREGGRGAAACRAGAAAGGSGFGRCRPALTAAGAAALTPRIQGAKLEFLIFFFGVGRGEFFNL